MWSCIPANQLRRLPLTPIFKPLITESIVKLIFSPNVRGVDIVAATKIQRSAILVERISLIIMGTVVDFFPRWVPRNDIPTAGFNSFTTFKNWLKKLSFLYFFLKSITAPKINFSAFKTLPSRMVILISFVNQYEFCNTSGCQRQFQKLANNTLLIVEIKFKLVYVYDTV